MKNKILLGITGIAAYGYLIGASVIDYALVPGCIIAGVCAAWLLMFTYANFIWEGPSGSGEDI